MNDIYFYDTEFRESGTGGVIELISIAIISLAGDEFYAISNEFDSDACSNWVKENVLCNLPEPQAKARFSVKEIASQIESFVDSESPTFWANYGCYDHVVLAQTFGDMSRYPSGWPYYTKEFQILEQLVPNCLSTQTPSIHDALVEARWLRESWLEYKRIVCSNVKYSAIQPLFLG